MNATMFLEGRGGEGRCIALMDSCTAVFGRAAPTTIIAQNPCGVTFQTPGTLYGACHYHNNRRR